MVTIILMLLWPVTTVRFCLCAESIYICMSGHEWIVVQTSAAAVLYSYCSLITYPCKYEQLLV